VTFYQSKPNLHNKFYKLAEQKFSHRKARSYVELLIVMQCQLKCELILYLKAVIVNERKRKKKKTTTLYSIQDGNITKNDEKKI
jgi:hypothetical protein